MGCTISTRLCLLYSVVFSLPSNVPLAPWGSRPAGSMQRAPAWDARAPWDILSSYIASHTAFSIHLLAPQPQELSCCLPMGFLRSESGKRGWCLFPSPRCCPGMALQQCFKEAGAQGLPPKAGNCSTLLLNTEFLGLAMVYVGLGPT